MATYTVSAKITGTISQVVEADCESDAIALAQVQFSIDDIEDWEEIDSTLEADLHE